MDCNEIGQPPVEKTLTLSKGDDYTFQLNFTLEGAPFNLSGSTFDCRFIKQGQTDVVFSSSVNNAAGVVTFLVSDTQTAAMAAGQSKNDINGRWTMICKWTNADGYTRRIIKTAVYVLA